MEGRTYCEVLSTSERRKSCVLLQDEAIIDSSLVFSDAVQ